MIAKILYFSRSMDFKFARSAEMAISFSSLIVVNRRAILKFRQQVSDWKFVRRKTSMGPKQTDLLRRREPMHSEFIISWTKRKATPSVRVLVEFSVVQHRTEINKLFLLT